MKNTTFQRLLLPGFIFQSVIVGGGYATGRELVEFFLSVGPLGGLLGMLLAMVLFSLITALSFELARQSKSYTYRSFFQNLLGRGWFVYEWAYFTMGLLVLAVIGAAAGEIVTQHLGLSQFVGIVGLMFLVGVLVFWGTGLIEKFLAGWSFILYGTYVVFVVIYLSRHGSEFTTNLLDYEIGSSWVTGGLKYVGYSVSVIPVIFFCVKHMESRRDAVTAGLLAGPLAMIPAFLFYLAMVASYPAILDSPVPADAMMQQLNIPWLQGIFYIVIFGTFVETGTAFIHAVNERISQVYEERNDIMPQWLRPFVAILALIVSVVLADYIGLIDLIAKGYSALAWAFIIIYILPLLTIGIRKIIAADDKS